MSWFACQFRLEAIRNRIADPDESLLPSFTLLGFPTRSIGGLSKDVEQVEKQAATVVVAIRRRAEEKGVSFEAELENYIQNFSHLWYLQRFGNELKYLF